MRLETKHLVVRKLQKNDEEDLLEYLSDPAVMKYIEAPFDRTRTKAFLEECGVKYSLIFALVEKVSEKVIGHVIFHPYDSEMEYEIGWLINSKYQHKGYAYEISQELIRYAFDEMRIDRIVAEAVRANLASLNVIQKLGMKEDTARSGQELCLYYLDAPSSANKGGSR